MVARVRQGGPLKDASFLQLPQLPAACESGDRFQIHVLLVADRQREAGAAPFIAAVFAASFLIEDPAKQHIQVMDPWTAASFDPPTPARQLTGDHIEAVWLEYVSPDSYRIVITPTKSGNGPQAASGGAVATAGWEWDAAESRSARQPGRL